MFFKSIHFSHTKDETVQNKIITAAEATRKWAEENYVRHNASENLCGLCAIASSRLWQNLQMRGIKSRLMMSNLERHSFYHVFVEHDGLLIDVTATQFGEEEIVIKPIETSSECPWYWEPMYVFDTPVALQQHQNETDWVHEQIAIVFGEQDWE